WTRRCIPKCRIKLLCSPQTCDRFPGGRRAQCKGNKCIPSCGNEDDTASSLLEFSGDRLWYRLKEVHCPVSRRRSGCSAASCSDYWDRIASSIMTATGEESLGHWTRPGRIPRCWHWVSFKSGWEDDDGYPDDRVERRRLTWRGPTRAARIGSASPAHVIDQPPDDDAASAAATTDPKVVMMPAGRRVCRL